MAGRREMRASENFARTAALIPVIVGALLLAIVAIFIFEAPNEITTPSDSGYLNTAMPVAGTAAPVTSS